jgi:phosphohistidine phosphatase
MANLDLYLLRHADAGDPAAWNGDDADRPLSVKGTTQAARLADFLAGRDLELDAIVSSPKLRARQTAEAVAGALGLAVATDGRLAERLNVDSLTDVIDAAGGGSVMLVGHDPDFSTLLADLIAAPEVPLKKGALARLTSPLPLRPGGARLRWLLPPDLVA